MGSMQTEYDLVVVGSGFAGTMTTLNFLEECKKLGKKGKVAMIEAGREGERCGASRWYEASGHESIEQLTNPSGQWLI